MAAIQSIRSHGKLIGICVGGALVAFILGDFLTSGATLFGASQTKMGEVNGNTIDYLQFQDEVSRRENFMKIASQRSTIGSEMSDEIKEYCWEQAVLKNTIVANAEKQGIMVTGDEIAGLVQTGNVTPTIRQSFANPEKGGAYDPALVSAYVSQTDARSRFVWSVLEDELRTSRITMKYFEMVNAGIYVTNAEVEREFAQRTQISDIKYVAIPYSDIKNEEVTVSEAALQKYYKDNIARFDNSTETRDIAYVSFDVIASQKDSLKSLEVANSIKEGLSNATADEVPAYINSKSDVPYSDFHYSKGDISNPIVDSLMFAEAPGFVYGPYVSGSRYVVARLIGKTQLPDSVRVSHILIRLANPADSLAMKAKADSILDVHKSGVDFGALAAQFSEDSGSARDSGKLGWVTERLGYIKEFSNACFATPAGATTIVRTGYGYHIIKVFEKTRLKDKVSVGFAGIDIRPSQQTRQEAYALASEFSGLNRDPKKFDQAVQEKQLVRRIAPNVTSNTQAIPGVENSRDIIRDMFNEDKCKEVSGVYEMGDRFIVASLAGIHPKGIQPLSVVNSEVTAAVINDAKGDLIIGKLGNVNSVDAVAAQMNKTVQEAKNIHLDMMQIPGIGVEPAVIAVAASLGEGKVSAPVKGSNAVYVLQNTILTPAQQIQPLNITTDKKQISDNIMARASYQVYQSILQQSDIEDNRVKFY